MAPNGWAAPAQVSVIAGNHQSIHGQDLMGTLGIEPVQGGEVMGTTGEGSNQDAEEYDELQTYFCKLYSNLFTRIGKIRNVKVRAEFFELLKPVQQKGRRVPIILQDKVDKEIHRLITEDHIIKLQESSDRHFTVVISYIFTVVISYSNHSKKGGKYKIGIEIKRTQRAVTKK